MTPDRSAPPTTPRTTASPRTAPGPAPDDTTRTPSAPPPPSTPTATYRLQVQPAFPFSAAEKAVPYLAALGVSHLHLSPVLDAVPGSPHGYDVVDHGRVRPELGGENGLRALARTAREYGLGLVADLVPNHMAVPAPESRNGALWHVLRDGPTSPFARWFDVDWADGGHGGRLLLPVLGAPLAEEMPHLRLEHGAETVLRYHDHAFPVRPGTAHLDLPRLLDAQWYRLGWWRLARTELNYRRFFTVNELIAVRVEDPDVFDATHRTVLRLLAEGVLTGLRVDHPDGLADPGGYLRRLGSAGGGRWTVVEKILTGDERLPAGWRCAGTTGYDALRRVDALFVCPLGAAELAAGYQDHVAPLADAGGDWEETVRRAAGEVVRCELAAEVGRLTRAAARVSDGAHHGDHSVRALRTALEELLARMPVYRPYAVDPGCRDRDTAMLERAAREARAGLRLPEDLRAVDFVRDLVLGVLDGTDHDGDFRARFAQVSSALRAKSVEDRAFYRYVPLLSACEVGGDPGEPALSADAFHAHCARTQADWPLTGTALSTHDTKRSADVRARIAVLTQVPQRWREVLRALRSAGAPGRAAAPDAQSAWVAWQTVFGLGERAPERVVPAVLKAAREAALHTSWTEPDAAYEEELTAFLRDGPCGAPGEAVTALAGELAPHVRVNVLGAALLHLTMPGVPDLYQGTEHEYAALVDPDNRAPARLRPEVLQALDGGRAPRGLSEEKLALTAAALRLRRSEPRWFGAASTYRALPARGAAAAHCVAFARADRVVPVVTRLSVRLADEGGWRDTRLPLPAAGPWRDLLTGARVTRAEPPVADLLRHLPVALLVRD